MPLTTQLIEEAVDRYEREADRYEKLATVVSRICRTLLETHSIAGTVQSRAKSPDRLRQKLQKYQASGEHASAFTDLAS